MDLISKYFAKLGLLPSEKNLLWTSIFQGKSFMLNALVKAQLILVSSFFTLFSRGN